MLLGLGLETILSSGKEGIVIFNDSFNRPDGDLGISDSGAVWKHIKGANGLDAFAISQNKLKVISPEYGGIAYFDIGVSDNYKVTFDFFKNNQSIEVNFLPKVVAYGELVQVSYGNTGTNIDIYVNSGNEKINWEHVAGATGYDIGKEITFKAEIIVRNHHYTVKLDNEIVFNSIPIETLKDATTIGFRMGGYSGSFEIDNLVVELL